MEVLDLLLEYAPPKTRGEYTVDVGDGRGLTPLHHASLQGHVDAVRLLCSRGAAVNMKDDDGRTAVFCATFAGHHRVLQALIDAKVGTLEWSARGGVSLRGAGRTCVVSWHSWCAFKGGVWEYFGIRLVFVAFRWLSGGAASDPVS